MKQSHYVVALTAIASLAISGIAHSQQDSEYAPVPYVTATPTPEPTITGTPVPSPSPTAEPTATPTPTPTADKHCCVRAYRIQYCGYNGNTYMEDASRYAFDVPGHDEAFNKLIPTTESCNPGSQWNFLHQYPEFDCNANAWSKMKVWYAYADYPEANTHAKCDAVGKGGYEARDDNLDGAFNDYHDWDNADLNAHLGPNPDPFRP